MALVGFVRFFLAASPFTFSNGGFRRGFDTYGEFQLGFHTVSPIQQTPAGPPRSVCHRQVLYGGPQPGPQIAGTGQALMRWTQFGFKTAAPSGLSYGKSQPGLHTTARGPDTGQTLDW